MRIFLSYHTPDRGIALGLKAAIESAIVGADVFIDQTNLRHGHLWQPALFEAIGRANAFLILVSNRLGDWQKVEYYEARDRKAKDESFVLLPVIVADRDKGPAANLPGLAQLHWIESTEPTAPAPLSTIVAALREEAVARSSEPWRAINPYRGLIALEEQDADFFFGRELETAAIVEHLSASEGRLVTLVGNSGVGKSSLVQAGVMGTLKRQRWPRGLAAWPSSLCDSRAWAYLTMKPGEDPISALASEFSALWFPDVTDPQRIARRNQWSKLLETGEASLVDLIETTDDRFKTDLSMKPPPKIFLYIDQGEELYARSAPAMRKRFSEIIAEGLRRLPRRLMVMMSQRADYYGELQANAVLFRLSERVDVAPLDAERLTAVLRDPAHSLGVAFETADFVDHIVRSAEDQPGALPLLADLFTDLWERMRERGDGVLRLSDRREIIQVGAALSKRADQFLQKHADKEGAVKRLFTLRLAHVPRQGEAVRARWERQPASHDDKAAAAEWALAEQLAGPDWRLLVTGERDGRATAEVAHEVLLKTWGKLKTWLEEERDFLVWRGEVDARREEWSSAGKVGVREQRQALLMGLQLDTARKWVDARRADIDPLAIAFIEASKTEDARIARGHQRLRVATFSLMLAALGASQYAVFKTDIDRAIWQARVEWPYIAIAREKARSANADRLPPGSAFRECDDCPAMVVVPAGSFRMGSPETEHGRTGPEGPVRQVKFAKPFAVGKFEVSWIEWETCVAMRGCDRSRAHDQGYGKDRRPVINVSWHDAKAYAEWLARVTGKEYRLLSEAEWEYAARGVTSPEDPHPAFPWHDDEICRYANLGDRAYREGFPGNTSADCNDRHTVTAEVGQYPENPFGLHDMHGNVWEWVEDPWHDSYVGAPEDGSSWRKDPDGDGRVYRGGGWDDPPSVLRSAYRFPAKPDYRYINLGFRVGRTLGP